MLLIFSSCEGILNPGNNVVSRSFLDSWLPDFPFPDLRDPRYPRLILAEEVLGAFEEALVQGGVLLADERGKFLQLPPLFRIQACRHLHNHARK